MHASLDVLVIGAGLSGFMAAELCHNQGLKTLCIEQKNKPSRLPQDQRAIIITTPTKKLCEAMGYRLPSLHALPAFSLWQQGKLCTTLHADELGEERLGHVLDLNGILQHHLSSPYVAWSTQIQDLSYQNPGYLVTLKNSEGLYTVKTRHIIAADGPHSTTRTLAGIPSHRHEMPYQAHLILAESDLENASLFIETDGTMAYLPKGQGQGVVIWTCRTGDEHATLNPTQMLKEHRITPSHHGKPMVYPLLSQRAAFASKPGLFLVGNAKQCVPPVAAQGLNMGMRDVLCCVDLITQTHLDPQSKCHQYQKKRGSLRLSHGLSHAPFFGPWTLLDQAPIKSIFKRIYPHL